MDDYQYRKNMMLHQAQTRYRAASERFKAEWGSYDERQKFQAYQYLSMIKRQLDNIASS